MAHSQNASATKTLYVVSLFWRNCDVLLTVAGFDRTQVKEKFQEIYSEELNTAADQDCAELDNPTDEDFSNSRDNLETDLCDTGINTFAGAQIESLGIPKENLAELESDGITVY